MFFLKNKSSVLVLDDTETKAFDFKIEGNQLSIIKEYEISDKDSLHFKNVILLINTKEVISKAVLSETAQDALEEAFPAIRSSDVFYDYQNVQEPVISIIKKSALNDLITKHDIPEKYVSFIRLSKTLHTLTNDTIENDSSKTFAELAVASQVKNLKNHHNFTELQNEFQYRLSNKRFFEITKWSAILIFLVGLTVNFIYHEKYRKQVDELKITAQSYKNIDAKLKTIEESVNANELLISSNNTDDINLIRTINNWIVNKEGIKFKEVTFQPLRSKISSDQKLRLDGNVIFIVGSAKENSSLEKFITYLKQQKRIDRCNVISIDESMNLVNFELEVTLNEAR